tara:strand:+ start:310 stop:693 length:384 start_codon:yes stop_codon:yes gene_type:complete
MAAGRYTFIVEQGATTDFEVEWKDKNGAAVDLAGYTGRMQIRSDYGSGGTLYANLTSTTGSDGTGLSLYGSGGVLPLASGSIGIYISATSSSAFTFDEAVYDLEMRKGTEVTRLLSGKVKLSKEVTV